MEEEVKNAIEFAKKNKVKLLVLGKEYRKYFQDDKESRWVFDLRLVRGKKQYSFKFGLS